MLFSLLSLVFAAAFTALVGVALRFSFAALDPQRIRTFKACSSPTSSWNEARIAGCDVLRKIPHQRVNTYSNLAYILGGAYLASFLNTPVAWVFMFMMRYLTVGSALYHGIVTKWSGLLDVTAMYAVFSGIAALGVFTALRSAVPALGALASSNGSLFSHVSALLVLTVAAVVAYGLRNKYRNVLPFILGFFGLATVLWVVSEILAGGAFPWISVSIMVGLFLVSGLAWIIDLFGVCNTYPLHRYGHGLWHVGTAAGISYLFYLMYTISPGA